MWICPRWLSVIDTSLISLGTFTDTYIGDGNNEYKICMEIEINNPIYQRSWSDYVNLIANTPFEHTQADEATGPHWVRYLRTSGERDLEHDLVSILLCDMSHYHVLTRSCSRSCSCDVLLIIISRICFCVTCHTVVCSQDYVQEDRKSTRLNSSH